MFALHLGLLLATLLSISVAAPTTDDCSQLTQNLTANELHQILGTWIFIEGFANNDVYNSILENLESTWMTLNRTADNSTLLSEQGLPSAEGPFPNPVPKKFQCFRHVINVTIVDDLSLELYIEPARTYLKFLQTCSECLVMFTYNKENDYQALYIYGRNKTLPASDLETFRKQAACLQFPQPARFHYDPSKELCPM